MQDRQTMKQSPICPSGRLGIAGIEFIEYATTLDTATFIPFTCLAVRLALQPCKTHLK